MPVHRKILVSLPADIIEQVDEACEREELTRSEFIRLSLKQTLELRHKLAIRESMKQGYQEMARINREWAEFGLTLEELVYRAYEANLSEREN